MQLTELNHRPDIKQGSRLARKFAEYKKLLSELKKRDLPQEIIEQINQKTEAANAFTGADKPLLNHLRKAFSKILSILEKEMKLVPINYYRAKWMAIGMAVFGVPMGTAFGVIMDNMGLMGVWLPIGMVMGMAVGSGMDKKAADEGRQLDLAVMN